MDTQTTVPPKPDLPLQIGRWSVQGQISEGAATMVYHVADRDNQQRGVLKLFKTYSNSQAFAQKEVQALALIHPNLPVLLDRGTSADGQSYLVTEYIQGPTLEELLHKMGCLPPNDAVRMVERVASAVDLAHSAGLLHRDLKPSNLVIPDNKGIEGVTLLDFSLAGQLESQSQQTQAGQFFGTPNYMSPEQLQSAPQTRATDVWGLGVLLYEMLLGKTPFQHDSVARTVYAIVEDTPHLPAEDPWKLDGILRRCLAKNPEDRFASAQELANELTLWLERRLSLIPALPSPAMPAPLSVPGATLVEDAAPIEAFPESVEPEYDCSSEETTGAFVPVPEAPPAASPRKGWGLRWLVLAALMGVGIVGATTFVFYVPVFDSDVPKVERSPVPIDDAAPEDMQTDEGEPGNSKASPAQPAPADSKDSPAQPEPARKPQSTPPDSPQPSTPWAASWWLYLLPFVVATAMWFLVRHLLGGAKTTGSGAGSESTYGFFGNLDSGERRSALTQNLGVAVDEMIAQCQGDAPANFMALSLGLAVQDYRDESEPGNKAASLQQAVKLLELLQQRVPNTMSPWYVRYNQLLALGVSVAGLILTLLGILLRPGIR